MTSGQKQLLVVGRPFECQTLRANPAPEISELLPHTAKIVDDICLIRTMVTDPSITTPAVTSSPPATNNPDAPPWGAWPSYGLGPAEPQPPRYVVLVSGGGGQPLQSVNGATASCPVTTRASNSAARGDAVLYVNNPPGIDAKNRRKLLDAVQDLNKIQTRRHRRS